MNNNQQNNMEIYENHENNMGQVFPEQPAYMETTHLVEEPEYLSEGSEYLELEYLSEGSFEENYNQENVSQVFLAFSGDVPITAHSVNPLITSPIANSTVPLQALIVRWNVVPGASYLISLRNLTTNVIVINRRSVAVGQTSFQILASQLTAGHRFRVAVASVFGGAERWSDREFSVQLHAPVITSPGANTTVPLQNLTVRWNAVPGATSYLISLHNLTTNVLPINRRAVGTTIFQILASQLNAGYRFRVAVASVSGSVERWSDREFSVEGIHNGLLVHERVIQQSDSLGYNIVSSRRLEDINRIVVHHTYPSGQNPTISNVNNWWPSNWIRAGYHFLIRGDGSIWQLVPIHTHSNGVENQNTPLINIAIAGSFTSTNLPTQAARNSFGFLCRLLLGSAQLPNLHNAADHIVGHRELAATACPGFPRAQYLSWV